MSLQHIFSHFDIIRLIYVHVAVSQDLSGRCVSPRMQRKLVYLLDFFLFYRYQQRKMYSKLLHLVELEFFWRSHWELLGMSNITINLLFLFVFLYIHFHCIQNIFLKIFLWISLIFLKLKQSKYIMFLSLIFYNNKSYKLNLLNLLNIIAIFSTSTNVWIIFLVT